MNSITLIGALTRDPEMTNRNKTSICRMRLVETGGRRESPLYIDVEAFGRTAQVCGEYLSKGRQIAVRGALRMRIEPADHGDDQNVALYSVAVEHIDFLSSGKAKVE